MVVVAYTQATKLMQVPTAVCAPINPRAGSWTKAPAPTNNGLAPGCS